MKMIDLLLSAFALIVLEIILGMDNLIFLSLLIEPLPLPVRRRVRYWGLALAWVARLVLLSLSLWMVQLKTPFLQVSTFSVSIRDVFLFCGGLFLIYKATQELHGDLYPTPSKTSKKKPAPSMLLVIAQLVMMDLIFSIDSVFTAVGLTSNFWIMLIGISCAIVVMLYASEPVGKFISTYPSIKTLAVSFLMLVGTVLVADSLSFHIPRGYLYFTMFFSCGVEFFNIRKGVRS